MLFGQGVFVTAFKVPTTDGIIAATNKTIIKPFYTLLLDSFF